MSQHASRQHACWQLDRPQPESPATALRIGTWCKIIDMHRRPASHAAYGIHATPQGIRQPAWQPSTLTGAGGTAGDLLRRIDSFMSLPFICYTTCQNKPAS